MDESRIRMNESLILPGPIARPESTSTTSATFLFLLDMADSKARLPMLPFRRIPGYAGLALIACVCLSTAVGAAPQPRFVLDRGATALTLSANGALLGWAGLTQRAAGYTTPAGWLSSPSPLPKGRGSGRGVPSCSLSCGPLSISQETNGGAGNAGELRYAAHILKLAEPAAVTREHEQSLLHLSLAGSAGDQGDRPTPFDP